MSFPYDPELVGRVKALVGRRWEPEAKRWICDPSAELRQLLHEHSFVVDDFATQILATAGESNSVSQSNHVLILRTGYNPELVEKIKQIPSRRWDKVNKQWSFSIVEIGKLYELASEFGLAWNVADKNHDKPQVGFRDGWLSVAFSADRDIQELMKELYGTRLHVGEMSWLVPVEYAPEVALAADRFKWQIDEGAQDVLIRYADETELLRLSKSQNEVLEIPGVQISLMPFQQAGVLYALKAMGFQQVDGRWERRTSFIQDSDD